MNLQLIFNDGETRDFNYDDMIYLNTFYKLKDEFNDSCDDININYSSKLYDIFFQLFDHHKLTNEYQKLQGMNYKQDYHNIHINGNDYDDINDLIKALENLKKLKEIDLNEYYVNLDDFDNNILSNYNENVLNELLEFSDYLGSNLITEKIAKFISLKKMNLT